MQNSKSAIRRVALKGMDTQYAKRDALRAANAVEAAPPPPVETSSAAVVSQAEERSTSSPLNAPAAKVATEKFAEHVANKSVRIRLDYRFGLGEDLSTKASALGAKHAIPVEVIIKSARVRALKALRRLLDDPKALVLPEVQEGGIVAVVSTSTSGKAAEKLRARFDPLDLGLAAAAIRPLVIDLVQKELRAIVEAAS
ncbi:hypothetical protein ACEN2J_16530 [Pseudorhodobacter sp. W20_MBD10_FR17]|uniref:hypothetical protein n=1 Tax=Pseudorhodobacter sp. W20_MBD10_FR17 TaxID=3240266 RepID=UPI003F98287A